MAKKGYGGKNILAGMSRKSPAGMDKSGGATGKYGSVNAGATRSGTAPTPKTLGPRTA